MNKSPFDYLDKSHLDSFFILPTSTQEIEEEILKLKNDKAVGPFSIPVRILKIIRHVVSRPLEAIFNLSFSTGIVPSSLKIAKVIPVFKKGSCTPLNNCRPISLLSLFNKLLEKLMYKRIFNYLDKKNLYCMKNNLDFLLNIQPIMLS